MQFTTTPLHARQIRCCLLWCKDTNFNAIHNRLTDSQGQRCAVYYGAKILILMQFTTPHIFAEVAEMLFIMVQRY